jgi:hypothetical protein
VRDDLDVRSRLSLELLFDQQHLALDQCQKGEPPIRAPPAWWLP